MSKNSPLPTRLLSAVAPWKRQGEEEGEGDGGRGGGRRGKRGGEGMGRGRGSGRGWGGGGSVRLSPRLNGTKCKSIQVSTISCLLDKT